MIVRRFFFFAPLYLCVLTQDFYVDKRKVVYYVQSIYFQLVAPLAQALECEIGVFCFVTFSSGAIFPIVNIMTDQAANSSDISEVIL